MTHTNRLASVRTALAIILGLALAAGAAYVFWSRPAAPDIAFTTLKGEATSLQQLRGKVVYVNFWATSCATCIKEMPDLVRTYERYAPRGFELLAVAMHYDPPSYVENYTNKNKLPFKVVLDTNGSIASAFGDVKLTPTAVLIDKQGRVFSRFVGEPDLPSLHAQIERELAD
ncbi:TlpA family protein disulfide reductase [Piscinibacter sp.]|uniref:TlpA family protein disulfide reductase n=1 Tax=Piscinibacter sp. TaxID=1903157 RepID=UPI002C8236C5|nr:TlpA disulfide reductase family protein [Albitalea sp.]HUG25400.1 TlpA disulfide reductase family protein [Albitalea sp.]